MSIVLDVLRACYLANKMMTVMMVMMIMMTIINIMLVYFWFYLFLFLFLFLHTVPKYVKTPKQINQNAYLCSLFETIAVNLPLFSAASLNIPNHDSLEFFRHSNMIRTASSGECFSKSKTVFRTSGQKF